MNNQQLLYSFFYNIKIIELEILKTFIEINLANNFIKHFKSLENISIIVLKKSNKSFDFYKNYYDLKNLTIKNQ